ncbi:MlaE family ABC transporter permease [Peredibacter starrii]|uniref:ABC transporter permease n=1 Tax=Peredibacter starrii TaxID=28202 RepID=A0AAX4HNU5_9BACT|nr:ABC transporter permease [Peredibacter starrii]WPU64927.1 ABC transporter permease [Peredibacter starrii]
MIGQGLKHHFQTIGDVAMLTKSTFQATFSAPFYWGRLFEQIVQLGIGSLSITIVIGVVTGLVMTLQFGYGLEKFGGTLYVPAIVSLSIFRELAPIFTSLLVAGRIGSGISAEIGAMNVTQQVDAIRALGTNPIRVLVVPRVVATVISLPLLTVLSGFMGIIGGLAIAYLEFNMPIGFYVNKVLNTINFMDVFGGMIKCAFFAIVISIIACYRGFQTKEGTRGVGTAATWVVVRASIIILISDFFLSKMLLLLFG